MGDKYSESLCLQVQRKKESEVSKSEVKERGEVKVMEDHTYFLNRNKGIMSQMIMGLTIFRIFFKGESLYKFIHTTFCSLSLLSIHLNNN